METVCQICGAHVPSGPALLILEGELTGGGTFTAKQPLGPGCRSHIGEGQEILASRFPLKFQL